ncbi:SRPBCC family protein [Caulobacter mirabilis]|uniref:ATPase n=1 Tax=Caulobacter mirabilis TaxID=69666 RepID=A0A2D2B2G1_9CAUL|nr:SRPBCC family protein [Caulobacter mirabilis]ATQ44449.1 ATPase [Caulobacter mirabilis]
MRAAFVLSAFALALAAPAQAEVKSAEGAVVRIENRVTVAAPPDKVYAALGEIGKWWNGQHSYTGDAANMTVALEPGACFCERFPKGGGVKHGEVVLAWPGQMLRIDAALGPLQDEGAAGALTFSLKKTEAGTEVVQTYNVGGLRPEMVKNAPLFDMVVGEQLKRFKAYVETGKPQ